MQPYDTPAHQRLPTGCVHTPLGIHIFCVVYNGEVFAEVMTDCDVGFTSPAQILYSFVTTDGLKHYAFLKGQQIYIHLCLASL